MAKPQEAFANNGVNTQVNTGGTTTPAALTSETWIVNSAVGWPTASTTAGAKTQFRVVDPVNPSEIILVTDTSASPTWQVTRGWEGTTPFAHPTGFTIYQIITADVMSQATDDGFRSIMPTLAIAETAPRYAWTSSGGNAGSGGGHVYMAAIWLRQNTTITAVNLPVVTASATTTHFWTGLADNTGKQLCHSADTGAVNLPATTLKTYPMTPIPFVTTYTGLHYILVSLTAGTAAFYGTTGYTASGLSIPPHLSLTSSSVQATPGTDGTTTYNVTAGASPLIYAYLS